MPIQFNNLPEDCQDKITCFLVERNDLESLFRVNKQFNKLVSDKIAFLNEIQKDSVSKDLKTIVLRSKEKGSFSVTFFSACLNVFRNAPGERLLTLAAMEHYDDVFNREYLDKRITDENRKYAEIARNTPISLPLPYTFDEILD